MKCALTQTADPAGSATFAQVAGSSVFGFLRVTASRTVTRSPCLSRVTISLLIAAWPRTFTFFSLATAGPGLIGVGVFSPSAAAVLFLACLALAIDVFSAVDFFFLRSALLVSDFGSGLRVAGVGTFPAGTTGGAVS